MKIRVVNESKYNPKDLLPTFATSGAAAIDLRVAECVKIPPSGQVRAARTGIKIELPDGVCGLILPRSGLGSKGIVLANTVGLIDSDYRGEIVLMLKNIGSTMFHIEEGERAAQMMFLSVHQPEFELVSALGTTGRGEGGFGSTGVK